MITTTNAYTQAVTATSRQFKAQLYCDGAVLDCDISYFFVYKGACGNKVLPGSVYVPYMKANVRDCSTGIEGREIIPYINIVTGYDSSGNPVYATDGSGKGIALGKFIATKPVVTTGTLSFKAVGKLGIVGGKTYTSALTYPARLSAVISEISQQLGMTITYNGITVPNKNVETSMSGILLREALAYIAMILGGFATEDSSGNVIIARFGSGSSLSVEPWRSHQQPEFNENDWSCVGVKVIVSEESEDEEGTVIPEVSYQYPAGVTPNVVLENPYMTESLFASMYPNIVGYTMSPCELDMTMGDPRLEPWDNMSITDLNQDSHTVPCLSLVHLYHGGVQTRIDAEIETETEENASVSGPISRGLMRAISDAEASMTAAARAKASADAATGVLADMEEAAEAAHTTLTGIYADAETAKTNAQTALTNANTAIQQAGVARSAAANASEYAARALGNLSTVQSVAETLTWITQHGTMTITSDTTPDPSHVYFVRDNNGDYQVGNYRYSVVTEPNESDISSYYELSIDESLNNYVGTHLAVDSEGLWLIPETANGNRVLIATGSGTSYPSSGTYIIGQDGSIEASFTENGVMLSQSTTAHLNVDYQSMEFIDRDGNSFLSIKDMRDKDGYVTEEFIGDGTKTTFSVYLRADVISKVTIDGTETAAYTHPSTDRDITFNTAPSDGAKISIRYLPMSWEDSSFMKTYTIGTRGDGIASPYSIVVGHECIADFGRSYAEGWGTIAHGDGSHAEGQSTLALHQAHSEGANTKAYASGSHAEGTGAEATGASSHAEGWYSIAGGTASHAQGCETIATGDYQTALGQYNIEDTNGTYAVIVGNGADADNRSNALTVGWDGAVASAGDITSDGEIVAGAGFITNGFASIAEGLTVDALYSFDEGIYGETLVDIDSEDLISSATDAQNLLPVLIPAICQKYPGRANTKFVGRAHPSSQAWYEILIYDTSDVDGNGMPRYAFGYWRQWTTGHNLNYNVLVNNYALTLAPMNQFPVGSVYTMSTNTNPSTILGYGTWSLIDKRFSQATGQTGVTWNATNTTGTGVDWVRNDHRIHMRLQFTNKVAFNDNNQVICTIDGNTLGLSGGYQSYPYGFSDGLNAILMNTLSWSGATATITKTDVSSSAGTRSTSTGQSCIIEFDFMFAMSSMLDSACDQFIWKRTA